MLRSSFGQLSCEAAPVPCSRLQLCNKTSSKHPSQLCADSDLRSGQPDNSAMRNWETAGFVFPALEFGIAAGLCNCMVRPCIPGPQTEWAVVREGHSTCAELARKARTAVQICFRISMALGEYGSVSVTNPIAQCCAAVAGSVRSSEWPASESLPAPTRQLTELSKLAIPSIPRPV